MSNPIAEQFLAALASNDAAQYARVLRDDVGLRVWGARQNEIYRPRERVVKRLMDEWSAWRDANVETLSVVADDTRVAIEFRIQATEGARYVEHNRAAFLALKENLVQTIDLYCPAPFPSARRKGWIAPANVSAEQVLQLFEAWQASFDIRESIPFNYSGLGGMNGWRGGSGDAHPGSNHVDGARWSAAEADAKIEEMIEYHRARNLGFSWFVNPGDTPADLCERLKRHGLVLAGDQALMARVHLDDLDIRTNPHVEIERVDGSNDETIEVELQIIGRCFNWTKEQIDARRPNFFERIKDPKFQEREPRFVARLDGVPVADSRLILSTGIAYLGGGSTLPEYRGQRVYSTLLKRRLEEARARGYNVVAIHAEPMSRRVVSKYGFKEYGKADLYAWMPAIDPAVIKSLVPDD
ncbi:MAG: GNAT family N-acetyltransferase [Anaerolineales bacterium]|nr:GNAT family N-acetyltransferase [Anaerolineales bacterium]